MESPATKRIFTKSWSENNGDQGRTYCIGFRCGTAICTCETNRGRGNNTKKKQYQSLLNVNGEQLPDPFTELEDNWIGEEKGVEKWPPILQIQIAEFILTAEQGSDLGKRLLSDYKEGKAFSYFDSQWLKEVFYHPISDTHELCFLKSQSTPSQRIGNVPHKIWVCVKKINGTVEAAYCTCFAG